MNRFLPWLVCIWLGSAGSGMAKGLGNGGPGKANQAQSRGSEEKPVAREEEYTAGMLFRKGQEDYAAGRYAEAARLFGQLIEDYSGNPDVAAAIRQVRPLLVRCKLQVGDLEGLPELMKEVLSDPEISPAVREEFSFWQGMVLLQKGQAQEAQEMLGAYYANPAHNRARRYEAFLLFANGYVQLGQFSEAARFLEEQMAVLPGDQQEVAGRAWILRLHCLMEAGGTEAALEQVRKGKGNGSREQDTHVITGQLLTLQLGAHFLEKEEWYSALECLGRVWSREQLLNYHRQQKQAWVRKKVKWLRTGSEAAAMAAQAAAVLEGLDREQAKFEQMESYDASRLLRLAQAFMGLGRWREAGAVLEKAVESLPVDRTLEEVAQRELLAWQQVPRWDKILEATARFLEKIPVAADSGTRAALAFARAEALHGLLRTEEAEREFGGLARRFPGHFLAPRAFFMGAFCQMELDRTETAIRSFRQFRQRFPDNPLVEESWYWEGLTEGLQKNWAGSRNVLAHYLSMYPRGNRREEAQFEHARAWHQELQHATAARELRQYRKEFPDHPRTWDAALLLGECLMAMGEMAEGMKLLRSIPEAAGRVYEEACFRMGDGLLLQGKTSEARELFAEFVRKRPGSVRLAEAVLQQGRAAMREGDAGAAGRLYWETLESLGDDPAHTGVEDLLLATRRLLGGGNASNSPATLLMDRARAARAAGQKTLAVRLLWARGHLLRDSEPGQARLMFLSLGEYLDPSRHHPAILADCADAGRAAGAVRTARGLYLEMRKWHPRAIEKDRSSYGLGMLSLAEGNLEEAQLWFAKSVKESVGGVAGDDARIESALLYRREGEYGEAEALLQKVVGSRLSQVSRKVRALWELGRTSLQRNDPERAAQYWKRCYLSGGGFPEFSAPAGLEYGKLLETRKSPGEALAFYREMTGKAALRNHAAALEARGRMERLVTTPSGQ